jgi:hypothetical protein
MAEGPSLRNPETVLAMNALESLLNTRDGEIVGVDWFRGVQGR